jgi:PAS domain S-box-containing protein
MDDAFLDLAEQLLLVAGDDGRVRAASPPWRTLLGYEPEALLGRAWLDLVHPHDAELATLSTAEPTAAGAAPVRVRLRHRDGGHRAYRIRRRVRDGLTYVAFLPLVGDAVGDARSPGFLQHVVEQLPALLWTVDPSLRFTSAAGAGMRLVGLNAAQAVGLSLYDYFFTTDPDFPAIAAHRSALAGNASSYDLTWNNMTWTSHVEPLYQGGHVVGAIGLGLDVTGQRRIERELRGERERLAVTLRSIGDGVVATDREGRVVLLNRVAEELTGWREADALGLPIDQVVRLLDESTRAPVVDPVAQVLHARRQKLASARCVLVGKEGGERAIADSGAPIQGEGGEPLGAVLVLRDVTLERLVDRELRTTQRLQALGVLAGGIAHDFNNMLTMVLANVSLARRRVGDDATLGALLADIEQASERATGLTRQLLTFARGGVPVRRPTYLGELVRGTVEFALRGARSRADISIAADLAPASVDEGQLTQVLSNLVINADEAMADGGTITVRARNLALVPPHPSRLPPGDYVEIEVRDHGCGIAPELLERVFDPFFSTKARGSGLGLASAHGIVESHDGRLSLVSYPGQGTTVTVLLPVTRDPVATRHVPADPAPRGRGRVLVMDDEASIRLAVTRMLEELGYEPEVASDGVAALATYRAALAAGRRFAVVILDLTVPGGVGGVEALRQLREADPAVCAVVSSGYAADPSLGDHLARGFRGVLPKPYKIERLAQLLAELLATETSPSRPLR